MQVLLYLLQPCLSVLLSVERVKVDHRSVFVVVIGYIVNHWIYSLFLAHLVIGHVSFCHG